MKFTFIKSIVVKWILDYLINNLTAEKIKEWTDWMKNKTLPFLETEFNDLVVKLKAAAARTDTPLDDAGVAAFELFGKNILDWFKK